MDKPPENAVVALGSLPKRMASSASSIGRVAEAPRKVWRLFRPLVSKLPRATSKRKDGHKRKDAHKRKEKARPAKPVHDASPGVLRRQDTTATNNDSDAPPVARRQRTQNSRSSSGRLPVVVLFVTNEMGCAVSRHNVVYPSGPGRGTPINHPLSHIPPNPWLHAFDDAQPLPPPDVQDLEDEEAEMRFMLRCTKRLFGHLEGQQEQEEEEEEEEEVVVVEGGEEEDYPSPPPPPSPSSPSPVSSRHLHVPSASVLQDRLPALGSSPSSPGRSRRRSAPAKLASPRPELVADPGAKAAEGAEEGGRGGEGGEGEDVPGPLRSPQQGCTLGHASHVQPRRSKDNAQQPDACTRGTAVQTVQPLPPKRRRWSSPARALRSSVC